MEVPDAMTAGKKKRWVRGAVVVLVIVGLIAGASVAVLYLGGDNIERLTEYFRQLPIAEEGQPKIVEGPRVSPDEVLQETVTTPSPAKPDNIAVVIQYKRQDQFSLEITNLERTQAASDIAAYTIAEDVPYSLIQILNGQDQIIVEEKFQVVTEVLVDGLGPEVDPLYALDESVSRFTLSLPPDEVPVKVRLVTQQGEILDERLFGEEQVRGSLFKRLVEWWLGGRQALGATASPSPLSSPSPSQMNIAVISSVPQIPGQPPWSPNLPVLNSIKGRIESGTLAIDPWSVYASRVVVTVVPNTQDLECLTVTRLGRSFPVCPNQAKIQTVLAQLLPGVSVDAVVVVAMDIPCNCGTSSYLGNGITAVGTYATGALVAHEFGHALAQLADEYYGDLGRRGPSGPNCFGSMEECQGKISAYNSVDGVCSQGCNNSSTVRPANLLMYNNLGAGKLGPVEKCVMGKAVAKIFGEQYQGECGEQDPQDEPPKGPGPAPGWYREY